MSRKRAAEIVRRFAENGMKLLLEHAENVRELLSLTGVEVVRRIRFEEMKRIRTTFVQRDFRHVEADVVLTAPLKGKGKESQPVVIYILIEHQSEPDEMMPLRLLEYVVAIYRSQVREWLRIHPSPAGFRYRPVLPVVFYTGTRRWERVGSVADSMLDRELFERWSPVLEPLFLNVRELASERLAGEGGFFGQVLRLVRRKQAPLREFRVLLREVVVSLEDMPQAEQGRWRELLSYIHGLVYHERETVERTGLIDLLDESVRTEGHRREVFEMKRTYADELKEEGALEEGRDFLLEYLRTRFGTLSPEIEDAIRTTTDRARLKAWFGKSIKAKSLQEVGVGRRR